MGFWQNKGRFTMISVNKCLFCGGIVKKEEVFCSKCGKAIQPLAKSSCKICGHEQCRCALYPDWERDLDGLCSCYFYAGEVRRVVSRFKFSGGRFLGRGMGIFPLMGSAISPPPPGIFFGADIISRRFLPG